MKSFLLIALMLGITTLTMGAVVITHDGNVVSSAEVTLGQPAYNIKLTQATAGAATIAFPTLTSIKFEPATVTFTADGGNNQAKEVAITATADVAATLAASTWSFTVTGAAAADNAATSFSITIIAASSLKDIPVTFVTGGAAVTAVNLAFRQAPVKIKFTMASPALVFYQFPEIANVKFSPKTIDFSLQGGDNQVKEVEITATADVAATIAASTWNFKKSGTGGSGYKVPASFAITIAALQNIPVTFVTGGAPVTAVQLTYGQPAVNIRFTQATASAATIKLPTLFDVKFDPLTITFTADGGNNQVKDVAITATADADYSQRGWFYTFTGSINANTFPVTIVKAIVPKEKTPTVVTSPPTPKDADSSSVMTIASNFIVALCAVIIIFAM